MHSHLPRVRDARSSSGVCNGELRADAASGAAEEDAAQGGPDDDAVSLVRPAGFEPEPNPQGNNRIPELGGATGGALGDQNTPLDPHLTAIIEAWPTLSEEVKERILAMVQNAD